MLGVISRGLAIEDAASNGYRFRDEARSKFACLTAEVYHSVPLALAYPQSKPDEWQINDLISAASQLESCESADALKIRDILVHSYNKGMAVLELLDEEISNNWGIAEMVEGKDISKLDQAREYMREQIQFKNELIRLFYQVQEGLNKVFGIRRLATGWWDARINQEFYPST